MSVISIRNLVVRYRGAAHPAIDDVSLELDEGTVGLIGPNGAGKTTLLRTLLGGIRPESGTVAIEGMSPDCYRRRRPLGFVPEQPSLAAHLTAREFLDGLRLLGGGAADWEEEIPVPIRSDLLDRRLSGLSLGERKRVEIAAALIGSPRVLLLDEPTNGLDPEAVAWLREALVLLRAPGRVIVVASHHLDELHRTVDRFIMIGGGSVRGTWTQGELRESQRTIEDIYLEAVRQP
jgi:ABC-2 type transport system ATP-binding protein